MGATITATDLRKNVYRILDEVLETGIAQEVQRNGKKVLIVPAEPRRRRFEDAPKRRVLNCSFDELVDTRWDESWKPGA